jgi:hypothetical protein
LAAAAKVDGFAAPKRHRDLPDYQTVRGSAKEIQMALLPSLRLWHQDTCTCYITPTTEPAPFWVVVLDDGLPVSRRSFHDHPDALAHALKLLERAIETSR